MQEGAAERWVKKNKKAFVRKMIRESGAEKVVQPAELFMAGLPGAGKTEFTKGWVENSGLKVVRLDMDEIASQIETYSPAKADRFRKSVSTLLSCVYDKVIKDRYNFVMDGTFGSGIAIQDVRRAIKRGYRIKVMYIYQDPKIAWEFTQAREKVEHRAINFQGFIEAYYRILDNLKRLDDFVDDGVSVDLVIKNAQNKVERIVDGVFMKDIDKYVNIEYTKDSLRRQIK